MSHDNILQEYLGETETEHELGSVYEVGADFVDQDGDEVAEVGARFRPRFGGGMFRNLRIRIPSRVARNIRRVSPTMNRLPGPPSAAGRQVPLGFPQAQLVNGAAVAAVITATVQVEPQLSFNPVRLLVNATDDATGTAVTGVKISSIKIGGAEMLTAGGSPITAQLFTDSYRGANPSIFDEAKPGVQCSISYTATVPGLATFNVDASYVGARS
jgi:hypothetical protein